MASIMTTKRTKPKPRSNAEGLEYGFGNEIERVARFDEDEPYEVLGPHRLQSESAIVIHAFLPRAVDAWVVLEENGKRSKSPMKKVHARGVYRALLENRETAPAYRLGFRDAGGYEEERDDPYIFGTEISDFDLYLIGEGTHFQSYEKFGARRCSFKGVEGVHFAVWAPNARSVSVVGNFNHWFPGAHPMARVHFSGVWGLFVPGLKEGEVYKFAIKSNIDGQTRFKADPYAFQAELRPHTASVVSRLDQYRWGDRKWMEKRRQTNPLDVPVSIYEVHLGSWKRKQGKAAWEFLSYADMADDLVSYVKSMGFTHIELLPITEHPLDESWGYQVVNYFAPTSRFGPPNLLKELIDRCHQNDIGVILDWVPAHFPKDPHGLADFDGREVYAYENWKKGEHRDWGTLVFDFGRNEVRNFLISSALFWIDQYHIDGLRVDAVASMLYLDYSRKPGEWEPNVFGGNENLEAVAFLKKFNEVVHTNHPGVMTIAEESTSWPAVSRPTYAGGLGFSMKWNMGWMHDVLDYFSMDPIYRKFHHNLLTFGLVYAFSENFVLPISHDEVVYGKRSLLEKMPGDHWQKFANLRLFLGFMYGHPGKKLLFMGTDIGQRAEWNCNASLDWHLLNYEPHRQAALFLKDLNVFYRNNKALYEMDVSSRGFEWIDFRDNEACVLSFVRWSKDHKELVLVVCNMTPVPRPAYRVGVPHPGFYREAVNSDAVEYGGSGMGNYGGRHADPISWHGRPYSVLLDLPPLGVGFYQWTP